ncbi:MAG: hypothetical protein HKN93_09020 [Acidimicrobiia bacterium]|nr:hypothetical protein [Acidimicrobiia bacterium]
MSLDVTTPTRSMATIRSGSRMPNVCTERVLNNNRRFAGRGRSPRHDWRPRRATSSPSQDHVEGITFFGIGPVTVTLPALMAKAKRRKLRARRKKANHGKRPNAGRG